MCFHLEFQREVQGPDCSQQGPHRPQPLGLEHSQVSSAVCFHWENSGNTSPGFPNTERWSVSNRKGLAFLSESGELRAWTCSELQAPGFSRYSKEQISPGTQLLLVCVIFCSNKIQNILFTLSNSNLVISKSKTF